MFARMGEQPPRSATVRQRERSGSTGRAGAPREGAPCCGHRRERAPSQQAGGACSFLGDDLGDDHADGTQRNTHTTQRNTSRITPVAGQNGEHRTSCTAMPRSTPFLKARARSSAWSSPGRCPACPSADGTQQQDAHRSLPRKRPSRTSRRAASVHEIQDLLGFGRRLGDHLFRDGFSGGYGPNSRRPVMTLNESSHNRWRCSAIASSIANVTCEYVPSTPWSTCPIRASTATLG